MESIRSIYKIGKGPSSSHTMGPRNAATQFLGRNAEAVRFEVTLYGSLAATGKGHMTDQAILEATRCLDCPDPQCVTGCPVSINIPGFIKDIERSDFLEAAAVLKETSALPAVCGRVCPQERQCESKCIYTKTRRPAVAIGYLERFATDTAREAA